MIDYQTLKNWHFPDIERNYTEKDVMLYALGVGFGHDPLDADQLRFTYEKNLQVVPSMAAVIGTPGFFWDKAGVDWVKLVHGEHDIVLHKTLPTSATIIAKNRIASITDKGEGKGAIVKVARDIYDKVSGDLLATSTMMTFLRGDGGFSAKDGVHDAPSPPLPSIPETKADIEHILNTLPQSALLYRLNGDFNPLHSDPEIAAKAGFPRPILHGLCTYGMAAHAVIQRCCDNDAARLRRFAVRFTSPVFPGETLRFEIWRRDKNTLQLRATVVERDQMVLNNGFIELH